MPISISADVGITAFLGIDAVNAIALASFDRELDDRGMVREAGREGARFFVLPGIYERFADRPTETPLPDPSRAVADGLNERS